MKRYYPNRAPGLNAWQETRNLPSLLGPVYIGIGVVAIESIRQPRRKTALTIKTWFKGENDPCRELVWYGTD